MKRHLLGLAVVSALLAGCDNDVDFQSGGDNKPAQATVSLRLMETTDLHANLMNYNYFSGQTDNTVGLVKTASLIRSARDEAANSVLVDNGDLIQGSPLGDYMAKIRGLAAGELHPIYGAMNLLDYDVANVGNHEFNFGLPFLGESINDADFPYISANVFVDDNDDNPDNDQPYFQPYLLKTYQLTDDDGQQRQLTIGYIGFVPPQIMQWDANYLTGKVKAKDMVVMAERYVPEMKENGADIVVAIPHSGLNADPAKGMDENAAYYLSQVDGIDALMLGHSHSYFPGDRYAELPGVDLEKGTVNGVAAVMPGFWGNNLGIIDLKLKETDQGWEIADSQSSLRPIFERDDNGQVVPLVESDGAVLNAVSQAHEDTLGWVNAPFATLSGDIQSFFAQVQDDPSIQVVNDAQIWYAQRLVRGTDLADLPVISAAAPFRTGFGGVDNYTYVPAGDIAYRNVADLYLYPNTVSVMKLTGAQVKEWLERAAGQFNQIDPDSTAVQTLLDPSFPSYNYDVIDGLSYRIDLTQPSRYDGNGELVAPDASRIQALSYQGQPLDEAQSFLVVTNNYRAGGGGNFPGVNSDNLVIAAPDENRQVLADYLMAMSEGNDSGYDPSVDGNWSFAPINAQVDVRFMSSGADVALNLAHSLPAISATGTVDGEGYAEYRLDLSH